MRRTGRDADHAYWLVFVNGVQQENCLAADDEECWAEVSVLDDTGRLIPTPGYPPWNHETRMVWGSVEFRSNPAALARPDRIMEDPLCRPPTQAGPLTSERCQVR